eukprot:6525269-Prymnesium_polylepis.1
MHSRPSQLRHEPASRSGFWCALLGSPSSRSSAQVPGAADSTSAAGARRNSLIRAALRGGRADG